MKIAILTLPLKNNYGGLLQAYALITTLKKLKHDPELIFLKTENNDIKTIMKESLKKHLLSHFMHKYSFYRYQNKTLKNTNYFIKEYINPKTNAIYNQKDLNYLNDKNYDVVIAGSDQVWRPSMNKYINSSFFNFIKDDSTIKLSYAASFGVDKWEYTENQTNSLLKDIQKFKAVSVREDSGIELCKKYFQKDAVQVLDPTMLLSKNDYIDLFQREKDSKNSKSLFIYILDESNEKKALIKKISKILNMKTFTTHAKSIRSKSNLEEKICPTVTAWIRSFYDAEYIITDSFHGCVFSIIFNKPFLVYGNKERGMARFHSILKLFKLENRMVFDSLEINKEKIIEPINWNQINQILEDQQKISITYLINNLKR